jgi:hypothetical protein
LPGGGTNQSYLLRRIARKAPEVLARHAARELQPKEHLLNLQKIEFPPIFSETREASETVHQINNLRTADTIRAAALVAGCA